MRVIAGEFRGRKLKSVPGLDTRPTPDRLRESLFNILQNEIEGTAFVDAYAGTGAVGIEALSRGASPVTLIERSRKAAQVIQDNLETLGALGRARVIQGSAATYLAAQRAGIVFLDPPYEDIDEYGRAFAQLAVNPPRMVIAQHAARHPLAESFGPFTRTRVVKQGDNCLSFYGSRSK
jgi:16S rRNA (guanine(966)-N(2))-methyltransferase RsmD